MYKKLNGLLAINLIFQRICFKSLAGRNLWKLQQTVSNLHMEKVLVADKESIMIGIGFPDFFGTERVVDCSELHTENKKVPFGTWRIWKCCFGSWKRKPICEDEDGKLLVANVILNRLNSEKFPDSVSEIVFQQENGMSQFSPIADGSYYKVQCQ